MKKIVALFLALVMCAGLVACGEPAQPSQDPVVESPVVEDTLADAIAYVKTIYKKTAVVTGKDYERIGTVPVGADKYEVVWTVDVSEDLVKIVKNENGMVTIDVNETNPEEITYVLTATITAGDKSESVSFNHTVPAYVDLNTLSYAEIVDRAYALEDGAVTDDSFRLQGTITKIDTAWSEDYQNITVTITVEGKESQPIMCYRLKGEGAKDLAVGDVITVEGVLKNYKGTIEFDAGCMLIEIISKAAVESQPVESKPVESQPVESKPVESQPVESKPVESQPVESKPVESQPVESKPVESQPVESKPVESQPVESKPVESQPVESKPVESQPVESKPVESQPVESKPVEDNESAAIVDAAYALKSGKSLSGKKTLTGTIVNINTAYDASYKNISVDIRVEGREGQPILCYRMKGKGAENLAIGNVITVTGTLKNYNGTIEFDTGCALDKVVAQSAPVAVSDDAAKILGEAAKLKSGGHLAYNGTLTGTITKVTTKYDAKYNNITVIIQVNGVDVECYRLRGDGIKDLKVGDTITVTGIIENYEGAIQFSQGCTLK